MIDRLAFVLPWDPEDYEHPAEIWKRMRRRVTAAVNAGHCERAYLGASRYRLNLRIILRGGSGVLVQIGARSANVQRGGIRIELNPARFKPGDAQQFQEIMRLLVGSAYPRLMRHPLINRLDVAVDIFGVDYEDLLVSYKRARRCTTFGKQIGVTAHHETLNFGSVTSDYMTSVYDKRVERRNAAILQIAAQGLGTEGLASNLVRQYHDAFRDEPCVRVEVRGKKMRGMPLAELQTLPNRFAWFEFVDLRMRGADLSELGRTALVAMWRQNGAKAAQKAFKHTPEVRAANAFVRARKAVWWQPESMWSDACAAIRDIGLFPGEAFLQPGA